MGFPNDLGPLAAQLGRVFTCGKGSVRGLSVVLIPSRSAKPGVRTLALTRQGKTLELWQGSRDPRSFLVVAAVPAMIEGEGDVDRSRQKRVQRFEFP